jgi:hypothetical protein
MAGETLLITELTGSERSVELRDRALPYQPVEWGGDAKHNKRVYPGNPVATIQVLGPDETDTTMKGKWKTRYVGSAATLSGFEDVSAAFDVLEGAITAERLVQVFHQLRRSGNLLEVRWGPEVRRGILANFRANYDRVEDIEWSATFVWAQIGEDEAPRAAQEVTTPQNNIDAALAGLEDLMAQLPPIILPNVTTAIILAEEAMRAAALAMTSAIANVSGVPTVTPPQFQGIASIAVQMTIASQSMLEQTSDQSIEEWLATDFVGDVLSVETFRRDLAAAARALWLVTLLARETIRARVVNDYLAIINMPGSKTLRDIALERYGDADAWETIADANGFVSAVVPAGTVIVIPRRSRSRGAAA